MKKVKSFITRFIADQKDRQIRHLEVLAEAVNGDALFDSFVKCGITNDSRRIGSIQRLTPIVEVSTARN